MSPRTMLDLNPALAMGKPNFQPRFPTPLAATPPVVSAGETAPTVAPPVVPVPSIAVSTLGKDSGISTTTTTATTNSGNLETSKKAFL